MPTIIDYYVVESTQTLIVIMSDGVRLEVPMSIAENCTNAQEFQEKMEKIYAGKIGGHANVT